ncbi:MAG: HAD-IA family hydrolase [bacterium]|nr:HAD-IA family hydrolase [bacterium]
MKKTYQYIIFDFDGTIVDSYETMIDIFNTMAHNMNIEPLSKEELASFRDMSPKEVLKALGVPLIRLPGYLVTFRNEYIKHIGTLNCIQGIEEILRELSATYHFSIVTSNKEEAVSEFLEKHNIRELFSPIYSARNIFGKHKVIQKLMKERSLDPETTLYVGDEVRDIEASKKAGIDIISVSWGLNSHNILAKHNPTYLIDNPKELITIL